MQTVTYIGENSVSLIRGNEYNVVSCIGENMIRVIDESGNGYIYSKECFNVTSFSYSNINAETITIVDSINELLSVKNNYIDYETMMNIVLFQPSEAYITAEAELAASLSSDIKKPRSIYVKKDIPLAGSPNWYLPTGTKIEKVTVIAGKGKRRKIDEINRLVENYKLANGVTTKPENWSKVAGQALMVNRITQQCAMVDVHWYECENIGRVETKYCNIIKQLLKRKV